MTTEALYLRDSYLREFNAKIIKVEGNKIILDKTAFYPESGGQLCDHGKIIRKMDNKEFPIDMVKKEGEEIVHYASEGLHVGDEIKGAINWERRHKLMRMHTAAHILAAIINLQTGALITGNQLGLDKSRIDFDLENFDKEALKEYFTAANDAVNWDLPVVIHFTTRDVLMQDKKLCKLLKGLPENITEVRIVEVNIFDKSACGGTHVSRTKEIGKIIFLDAENRGANNRRVYFKVE